MDPIKLITVLRQILLPMDFGFLALHSGQSLYYAAIGSFPLLGSSVADVIIWVGIIRIHELFLSRIDL